MLSQSDAQLIAHEHALSGLPLLLNNDAFANKLASNFPDIGIDAARTTYVRYKPGVNCLVAFDLQTDRGNTTLYAVTYHAKEQRKIHNRYAHFVSNNLLGIDSLLLDEGVTVVYPFPNDRRLSRLPLFDGAEMRYKILKHTLPKYPHLWDASIHPVRVKPERRYVARLEKYNQHALLKLYTDRDFNAASTNSKIFSSDSTLQIAQRLGRSKRHCLQILEWMPGCSLDTQIDKISPDKEIGYRIGVALAEFHTQPSKHVDFFQLPDELASLDAAQAAIIAIAPHFSERVTKLQQRLAQSISDCLEEGATIHGDFSADQILLCSEASEKEQVSDRAMMARPMTSRPMTSRPMATKIGLLDLDRARYGDPATDLGSFAAELQLKVVAGQLTQTAANAWVEALCYGYSRASSKAVSDVRLQIHKATRLFCRIVEPFRYRWPDWLSASERLITDVERTINYANK